MLVEVRVEQGLQCEHGITHRTLIDHPDRKKSEKKNLRKTLVDTVKYKRLEEKKCQCLSDYKTPPQSFSLSQIGNPRAFLFLKE